MNLFKDGTISSSSSSKIEEFSKKYCVDAKLVTDYLKHLEDLKTVSLIQENEREKNASLKAIKNTKTMTGHP